MIMIVLIGFRAIPYCCLLHLCTSWIIQGWFTLGVKMPSETFTIQWRNCSFFYLQSGKLSTIAKNGNGSAPFELENHAFLYVYINIYLLYAHVARCTHSFDWHIIRLISYVINFFQEKIVHLSHHIVAISAMWLKCSMCNNPNFSNRTWVTNSVQV